MKQEKVRAIIKEKVEELSALCRKIDEDFDMDTIHAFRVAVKTLRSFLRLLRVQAEKPALKMPKSFKRLYHIAGAIRDARLEKEQMAENQQKLPGYMDKLEHVIEIQKREWGVHYSKKTLRKLENRLMSY